MIVWMPTRWWASIPLVLIVPGWHMHVLRINQGADGPWCGLMATVEMVSLLGCKPVLRVIDKGESYLGLPYVSLYKGAEFPACHRGIWFGLWERHGEQHGGPSWNSAARLAGVLCRWHYM